MTVTCIKVHIFSDTAFFFFERGSGKRKCGDTEFKKGGNKKRHFVLRFILHFTYASSISLKKSMSCKPEHGLLIWFYCLGTVRVCRETGIK